MIKYLKRVFGLQVEEPKLVEPTTLVEWAQYIIKNGFLVNGKKPENGFLVSVLQRTANSQTGAGAWVTLGFEGFGFEWGQLKFIEAGNVNQVTFEGNMIEHSEIKSFPNANGKEWLVVDDVIANRKAVFTLRNNLGTVEITF